MRRRSGRAAGSPAASATGAGRTGQRRACSRCSPFHQPGQGACRRRAVCRKATRKSNPMTDKKADVCFAAVCDLHCTEASAGTLRGFFAQASEAADALLLCGDLTDYGTQKEAKVLADELSVVAVPVIA